MEASLILLVLAYMIVLVQNDQGILVRLLSLVGVKRRLSRSESTFVLILGGLVLLAPFVAIEPEARIFLMHQVLCGSVLALGSVVLYEWTRRTVIDRNFYTALAGEVPAAVCRNGPYRVRHPFYLSYMLAFLGMVAAFPSVVSASMCLLNIALFVYMAFDDERVLLQSALADDYQAYRMRAGMFLPRARV